MANRQDVADAVGYLCKRGKDTFNELFPVLDRNAGEAPKLKFVEHFVDYCIKVSGGDLAVLAAKSPEEIKAEEEAKKASENQ